MRRFMKIRISTLPVEGVILKEKLSLDELNARMAEGRDNDIIFTTAPEVEIRIQKSVTGAETSGWVKSSCMQNCARCAVAIERPIEAETNFILLHVPEDADPGSTFEDDIGLSYFAGDHVDLDSLIQEALILQLVRYWHPEEDQNGNCKQCGISIATFDESEESAPKTKLGALLKKAGVKLN